MPSNLDALLRSLVDYAGLFPPASLSLDETLERYAAYRSDPDAPMLGRLILPVSRFGDASRLWQEMGETGGIPVSALLPRTADIADFREKAADLFSIVKAALDDESQPLRPEVLEIPLPDSFGDVVRETDLGAFVQMLDAELDHLGISMPVFLEPPMSGDFLMVIDGMTSILATRNLGEQDARVGWKLRCGGLHASAFPDSDTISRFLAAAGRHDVPLKATAGLHHPFPQQDETLGARMHGFVNLLAATVLARRSSRDRAQIAAVLDEDDPAAFSLFPTLAWRNERFDEDEIDDMRTSGLTSYGSCSFDEPRDELRSHGVPLDFTPKP